jgi:hypothetical protein
MPVHCSGPRPYAGDLFIPDALYVAIYRAREEKRRIMIRRAGDGTYDLLIQADDEIDALEDQRRSPVLYCTITIDPVDARAYVHYADGRVEQR